MNTYESAVAYGLSNGWLRVNPPRFVMDKERAAYLKQKRAMMQKLRDERRARGLNAAGKPFRYSAKNKIRRKL